MLLIPMLHLTGLKAQQRTPCHHALSARVKPYRPEDRLHERKENRGTSSQAPSSRDNELFRGIFVVRDSAVRILWQDQNESRRRLSYLVFVAAALLFA